jgi:hypothetical protein
LLLATLTAGRDILKVIAAGDTILPAWCERQAAAVLPRGIRPAGLPKSAGTAIAAFVNGYLGASGIQGGYGFFAPNVPPAHQINLEIELANGRVRQSSVAAHSEGGAVRVATLIEFISRVEDERVRVGLIKYLVYAAMRGYDDPVGAQVNLTELNIPSPAKYAAGERLSIRSVHQYAFTIER